MFLKEIVRVKAVCRVGEDFEEKLKELGRLYELGASCRRTFNCYGFVGVGDDFEEKFKEFGMLFELETILNRNAMSRGDFPR